jgi:hypothetical protein
MDASFFAEIFEAQLAQLHTAFPARVESFDAATQTVDVTPQLKTAYPDGEGGFTHKAMPVLPNVPVCFPRAGSFFLSFPLAKGDFVLVVVCDRSLQAWRDKGQAVEPGDLASHPLDGAVAIPGVFPESGKLNNVSASTMKMGKDGTSAAQIEITDSLVKLGGGAQFVALANKVNNELQAIQATLESLTAVGTTTVEFTVPYSAGTVDAANVKAT